MPPAVCAVAKSLDERVRTPSKETIVLDGQPLSAVFQKYQGELLRYLLKMTGHREDAEDLLSQTFLNVTLCYYQYRPGTHLRAWLYRIARNAFVNQYRRRQQEERYLGSGEAHNEDKPIDTPETRVAQREIVALVQRSVDGLPEQFRNTARLDLFREYGCTEVASALNIPVGTVLSRLHRARKRLQKDEGLYDALK